MNRQGRFLLLSCALNLALAGYALFHLLGRGDHLSRLVDRTSTPSADILSVPESDLPSAELERLRKLGLTDEETMPIIVNLIRERVAHQFPAGGDRYWEDNWQGASQDSLAARTRQSDAIRSAVLAMYGARAESVEPLRDLFRPLDTTMPFLSPTEQRALVQFRLSRSAHAIGPPNTSVVGMTSVAMPAVPPGGPSLIQSSNADFLSSLPAELSDANKFEVALRESPLAARLRAADADLTETEFRVLFRAMADADAKHVPLQLDAAAGQVPRSKVLKVVSHGDPAWLGLQSVASRFSLTDAQVLDVYEAVRQANASLAAFAGGSNGGPVRSPNQIGSVMEERQLRIAQIVGVERAAAVLDALNESYRSFVLRAPPNGTAGRVEQ